MSCWKRGGAAAYRRAVGGLSCLRESGGRRLVGARLHLLPFAFLCAA